jgi:phage gpG-like protein
VGLGVTIKGDWRPLLSAVEKELVANPTPLLKVFGLRVLREVDEIFRAQGKPAWAPLKPSTVSAKRQATGKASRGTKALAGLRSTFDMQISGPRQVTVFSTEPKAIFHEFGTKGPYEIRPKTAKALALPFLPGRDAGTGTARSGKAGKFSLSGLGRARATGRGSFTTPGGATKVAYSNVSFRVKVIHPGLPARRMLPTADQIIPILKREATAFIAHLTRKRAGG